MQNILFPYSSGTNPKRVNTDFWNIRKIRYNGKVTLDTVSARKQNLEGTTKTLATVRLLIDRNLLSYLIEEALHFTSVRFLHDPVYVNSEFSIFIWQRESNDNQSTSYAIKRQTWITSLAGVQQPSKHLPATYQICFTYLSITFF